MFYGFKLINYQRFMKSETLHEENYSLKIKPKLNSTFKNDIYPKDYYSIFNRKFQNFAPGQM